jgi:hypothetical protein
MLEIILGCESITMAKGLTSLRSETPRVGKSTRSCQFFHGLQNVLCFVVSAHYTYDIFGALSGWLGRTEHCAWHDNVAKANVDASLYWFFLFDILANPF